MDAALQGETTAVAWLEVVGGPGRGHRIAVHDSLRFGSDEVGEGGLGGDRWLSPSHALIRHGEHGWVIEDLRSVEGTRVNGRPVRGATVLQVRDAIELGASRLAMVPEEGSTKPPGRDLSHADLRPVWRKRRRAWWIDRAVMLPVAWTAGFIAPGRVAVGLAYTALTLTYHFACEALTGQTLGKRLMGIRVVDMRGRPLRPAAAAARAVLLLLDSIFVGLISILMTGKRQQRLGDLAAGTVVAPAETPFVPARSKRDRLMIWAYPLAWMAPCVWLFLFVPWASAPECGVDSLRGEGICHVGQRVLDVRAAGHAVRTGGVEAGLVTTRSRELRNGFRRVSFQLELENTGGQPLRVASDLRVTLGVIDDTGLQDVLASQVTKPAKIAPGSSARVWFRFAVPPNELQRLSYAPTHLGVASVREPDRIGWISLWHYAGEDGLRAVSGLSG
ncbi:MAG: RDD family protein [Gaiellaceae bacterium]